MNNSGSYRPNSYSKDGYIQSNKDYKFVDKHKRYREEENSYKNSNSSDPHHNYRSGGSYQKRNYGKINPPSEKYNGFSSKNYYPRDHEDRSHSRERKDYYRDKDKKGKSYGDDRYEKRKSPQNNKDYIPGDRYRPKYPHDNSWNSSGHDFDEYKHKSNTFTEKNDYPRNIPVNNSTGFSERSHSNEKSQEKKMNSNYSNSSSNFYQKSNKMPVHFDEEKHQNGGKKSFYQEKQQSEEKDYQNIQNPRYINKYQVRDPCEEFNQEDNNKKNNYTYEISTNNSNNFSKDNNKLNNISSSNSYEYSSQNLPPNQYNFSGYMPQNQSGFSNINNNRVNLLNDYKNNNNDQFQQQNNQVKINPNQYYLHNLPDQQKVSTNLGHYGNSMLDKDSMSLENKSSFDEKKCLPNDNIPISKPDYRPSHILNNSTEFEQKTNTDATGNFTKYNNPTFIKKDSNNFKDENYRETRGGWNNNTNYRDHRIKGYQNDYNDSYENKGNDNRDYYMRKNNDQYYQGQGYVHNQSSNRYQGNNYNNYQYGNYNNGQGKPYPNSNQTQNQGKSTYHNNNYTQQGLSSGGYYQNPTNKNLPLYNNNTIEQEKPFTTQNNELQKGLNNPPNPSYNPAINNNFAQHQRNNFQMNNMTSQNPNSMYNNFSIGGAPQNTSFFQGQQVGFNNQYKYFYQNNPQAMGFQNQVIESTMMDQNTLNIQQNTTDSQLAKGLKDIQNIVNEVAMKNDNEEKDENNTPGFAEFKIDTNILTTYVCSKNSENKRIFQKHLKEPLNEFIIERERRNLSQLFKLIEPEEEKTIDTKQFNENKMIIDSGNMKDKLEQEEESNFTTIIPQFTLDESKVFSAEHESFQKNFKVLKGDISFVKRKKDSVEKDIRKIREKIYSLNNSITTTSIKEKIVKGQLEHLLTE